MNTIKIYSQFILYAVQKNNRDILKSNTPDLFSEII